MKHCQIYLFFLLFLIGCIEEKVVTVEVEKQTSWTEIQRFDREDKIVISTGHGKDAVYFQQPGFFTTIFRKDSTTEITRFLHYFMPKDISIILPIKCNFVSALYDDTTLLLYNVNKLSWSSNRKFLFLKTLTPDIVEIKDCCIKDKIMTINDNSTLLLYFTNNLPDQPYTFLMVGVKTMDHEPYIDTTFTKIIKIPNPNHNIMEYHLTGFFGFDDYFVVDLDFDGIYKFYSDGSFKKVLQPQYLNTAFKWQGKIIGISWDNRICISSDNAETWSTYSVYNDLIIMSKYYQVGDSLVGAWMDNMFNLQFIGNQYTMTFLKNDGLENNFITGIETLGDSVYVATLSGVFVKPISKFFDVKE